MISRGVFRAATAGLVGAVISVGLGVGWAAAAPDHVAAAPDHAAAAPDHLAAAPDRVAAAPTPAATPIAGTEGASFSGQVASFSASCPNSTAAQATIAWGDGGPASPAQITRSGSELTFSGAHTYAEEGGFSGSVSGSYDCPGQGSHSFQLTFTAAVADASLTITAGPHLPAKLIAHRRFTTTVATFTDADPAGTARDYTALIAWGDGSSSKGGIAGPHGAGHEFTVTAHHTYGKARTYTITVRLKDHGSTYTARRTAHVHPRSRPHAHA